MHTLPQLIDLINNTLASEKLSRAPKELYEPIVYTMESGGKRFRPTLTLMACEMLGVDIQKALYPALGIEIFHNFTLLHDDIMDQAPMRRGKDTVYKKWNNNVAILSGDAMFALAYEYIIRTDNDLVHDVVKAFNNVALGVCEGQQYDMNFETSNEISISDYLEMIRLKTSVLAGGAIQIGGIIGRASKEDLDHLYFFGEKIGLAFQLQDDLLDVYSNVDKFGKIHGGDIAVNKKTYLYLKALEVADPESEKQLRHYFSSTKFNQAEKYNAVRKIYDKLAIKEKTKEAILRFYQEAKEHLQLVKVSDDKKAPLLELAEKLIERDY